MENIVITNHAELLLRINQLKAKKIIQEEELKICFSQFILTLNPLMMVKNSLHQLAEDKEVKVDVVKIGLNMGTTFLLDMVLGRHRSVKGFLSSELAGKFSSLIINSNLFKMLPVFNKLKQENGEEVRGNQFDSRKHQL